MPNTGDTATLKMSRLLPHGGGIFRGGCGAGRDGVGCLGDNTAKQMDKQHEMEIYTAEK